MVPPMVPGARRAALETSRGVGAPGGTSAGTPGRRLRPPPRTEPSRPRGVLLVASRARLGPVVPAQARRYYRPPLPKSPTAESAAPF
jgi:hypothetical protein